MTAQNLLWQSFTITVLIVLITLAMSGADPSDSSMQFPRAFAPADGPVTAPERPYRDALCLNGRWRFQPIPLPATWQRDQGVPPDWSGPSTHWETVPIRIPSPWNANTWGCGRTVGAGTDHPYWPDSVYFPSYPPEWDGVEMGWLTRTVHLPAQWAGKRIILHFEAVAGDCRVLINDQLAGEHRDRFLPFDCDITDLVHIGADNDLVVGVRHTRLSNQTDPRYPHYRSTGVPGSTLDGIIGIWQDVTVMAVPAIRSTALVVQPWLDRHVLTVQATIRNDSDAACDVTVAGQVSPWVNDAGTDILHAPEPQGHLGAPVLALPEQTIHLAAHASAPVTVSAPVDHQLALWTPEAPHLQTVVVTTMVAGARTDAAAQRFGWRQFRIVGPDLLLNGEKIQITADILHPFGLFIQTRRHAWAWYRMIKDVGGNGVRLHAQPWPSLYAELADEMGIIVLAETGLFGSSLSLNFGQPASWQRYTEHVHDLIERDRNHPSVVGWSIGNELFAIFEYNHLSDTDSAAAYRQLTALAHLASALDPTRPWVSCDGDEDLHGTLPVWSKHFGHGLPLDRLPTLTKPLMVGESGGTYYATPGQLAQFNGDRAYESYAGRNEALAIDVYQNIVQMARPRLSYYSASELAWFGLEHLPLGYHDRSRLPSRHDGIVFGPFVEGVPGVQPERIPPYCSTFNPGFDPGLPLYRPMAMFTAMQAALAKDGPKPCPWDHPAPPVAPATPATHPPASVAAVGFLGDRAGACFQALAGDGVPFMPVGAPSPGFLIIDGQTVTAAMAEAGKAEVDAVVAHGGTVLISLRQVDAATAAINRLLPEPMSTTTRTATALVPGSSSRGDAGWSPSAWYFAENPTRQQIIACGLDGAFVQHGEVILTASSADWTLFNNVSESAKCAAMVLSEQLITPSGAALVVHRQGSGQYVITSIDPLPRDRQFVTCWRTLLERFGVQLRAPECTWILPIATVAPVAWHYTLATPASDWTQVHFDDQTWTIGEAGFGTDVPNSHVRSRWTSDDIWLRTTVIVDHPVAAPLHLIVHHDEDVEVYLDGERIFAEAGFLVAYKDVPLSDAIRSTLHAGTHQISVHCHQTVGGQYIDVGLASGLILLDGTSAHGHDLLLNGPGQ
jgi:beta-galactosidase